MSQAKSYFTLSLDVPEVYRRIKNGPKQRTVPSKQVRYQIELFLNDTIKRSSIRLLESFHCKPSHRSFADHLRIFETTVMTTSI